MAPHSSTLGWIILWTEEPDGYSPWDREESDTTEQLHFSLSCIGEENGTPLQYSYLENPRDKGAWWATVHRVTKNQTRLSDFTFTFTKAISWTSLVAQTVKHLSTMRETRVQALGWEDPLEKEMAIHSSTIAWRIPGTEEPGRLQSMGSQRVGHD